MVRGTLGEGARFIYHHMIYAREEEDGDGGRWESDVHTNERYISLPLSLSHTHKHTQPEQRNTVKIESRGKNKHVFHT